MEETKEKQIVWKSVKEHKFNPTEYLKRATKEETQRYHNTTYDYIWKGIFKDAPGCTCLLKGQSTAVITCPIHKCLNYTKSKKGDKREMKIKVTAEMLKDLGNKAIEIGTERNFIPVALEWIKAANEEINRLNALIVEAEGEARKVK